MSGLSLKGLVKELRRRRTFRTAGLYIVGAWLIMQAADLFFPAWGLPDAALNGLLLTAILGFPVALVFGWFYDVTPDGIVRTPAADGAPETTSLPLQRQDYVLLTALGLIATVIVAGGVQDVARTPRVAEARPVFDPDAPVKREHSVAVLPFANTSNDPGNDAFCDGMSDEILHKLASYADLHVIGRTSSFAFKNSDYTIPRIAALLNVRYLLQGSVRRDGDQLRILASLVDDTGAQLWSSSYDRRLESVFAIQAEIADVVAATVVPQIVPRKLAPYQPDLEAYQHYLVGKDLLWRRNNRMAAEALQKATELDPGFAAAYAELAIVHLMGPPDLERGAQALETAVALDPDSPRTIAARGFLLSQQSPPDPEAAIRLYREALARDPNMVDAMNWLAIDLSRQGKYDAGLSVLRRAAQIDPLHSSINANLAAEYLRRGETALAERLLTRLLEAPNPPRAGFIALRSLYLDTGDLVSMNAVEKRLVLSGEHVYYGLALNYAVLGLWDEAERWLTQSQRDFPEHAFTPMYPAVLPYWQGRYADAAARMRENEQRLERTWQLSRYFLALYYALAANYDQAIAVAEPALHGVTVDLEAGWGLTGFEALAWAYLQSGREHEANTILRQIDRAYADVDADGRLHNSDALYLYATNAVVMNEPGLALERLQRAVQAGWRQYEINRHDPRWAPLHGHPRYQGLVQRVVADVKRQREQVERIDADDNFVERYENARALRRTAPAGSR